MISRLITAVVCCALWPPFAAAQVSCSGWGTGEFFAKATAQNVTGCIAAGADPGARFTARGITPLHLAAGASRIPSVVTALLDAGANLEARTETGLTPLHWAAAFSTTPEVVTTLLNAGADLEARDELGITPLHWAARGTTPQVVTTLLNAGANLEARDEIGLTPLHWAARGTTPEVVTILLNARADREARGVDGSTVLHWAARSTAPAVVTAILNTGADVSARDKFERTPLHWAAQHGTAPPVVSVLLDAGADPIAVDHDDKTPWDLIRGNDALKGTSVYWQLNDARFQPTQTEKLTSRPLKGEPLTLSEIDALKTQIERCWIVQAGTRYAADLVVTIRVFLNPDGSLRREPQIVDDERLAGDPFFRAAAESAIRAVLKCEPFKLPFTKYHRWREIELTFDPREMLG